MTATDDRCLIEVPKIMAPGAHLIAPGFLGAGRESALARAEAAFHRVDGAGDHGR